MWTFWEAAVGGKLGRKALLPGIDTDVRTWTFVNLRQVYGLPLLSPVCCRFFSFKSWMHVELGQVISLSLLYSSGYGCCILTGFQMLNATVWVHSLGCSVYFFLSIVQLGLLLFCWIRVFWLFLHLFIGDTGSSLIAVSLSELGWE